MATTVKRISFCLTLEAERQLAELQTLSGENRSQVITRAVQLMYMLMQQRLSGLPK